MLDALALGFRSFLIVDACRGVGLHTEDVPNAIDAMRRAGAELVNARDWRA